ncbi:MAG: hypothetical protein JWP97_2673 [Labilithrix sp.]|nr:hypothetical protein [Labilithrix sp.]
MSDEPEPEAPPSRPDDTRPPEAAAAKRPALTRSQNRVLVAALAAAGLGVAGLVWQQAKSPPRVDDAAAIPTLPDEPAVPAPDQLLADVSMGTPNASWQRMQRSIGGVLGILPSSAGGILCLLTGLDPLFASHIDGASPAYGVVAGDPGDPHWLFAVRLSDLARARADLFEGDVARFTAREDGGVTEVLPKERGRDPAAAVGVSTSGYLLVAGKAADLARLGPYVTRTLPKRPPPAEGALVADVPQAALATLVQPKLADLWSQLRAFLLAEDERMRRSHGGRAPDFGDPKAIVTILDGWVQQRIGVVSDLSTMRVALGIDDDGIDLTATMTPRPGGGPASTWTKGMVLGDAAAIGTLPRTSAIALSMRDSEAERQAEAAGAERLVTEALGTRLAEADQKRLHAVLADATAARGELLTMAAIRDEPQGLVVRAPVRDADASGRAMNGLVELLRTAPFKQMVRARDVTTRTEDQGGSHVSLATITREPRPAERPAHRGGAGLDAGSDDAGAPKKDELGLAWMTEGGSFTMGAGEAPLATLAAGLHPDAKLADELLVTRRLATLGSDVNTVLLVQPLRFDPLRANLPTAPLVASLGRRGDAAFLRVDVTNGLLRELSRWQLGL